MQVGVELRIYFFGTAVDVSSAPHTMTRTYAGVSDRSAQRTSSCPRRSCSCGIKRICLRTWRPAGFRSLWPRRARSPFPSLARSRTGIVETAQLPLYREARVGPATPCRRCVPTCRKHRAGKAVALDSSPAVAPFPALHARRRATTGSQRHAQCGRGGRASRCHCRTYPAHGARHRNKKPKKMCPDATRRRG